MTTFQRYSIFFFGIIVQSAGVALVVKSMLGTSPISSVPYALSLIVPYSFGQTTLAVNLLFLLGQIVLLRHRFHKIQLLQAPATALFAFFIDVFMAAFSAVLPEFYTMKLLILFLGAAMVSLGVALQVIANVLMLSGEGIVYAISQTFHIDFGKVKTAFDCFFGTDSGMPMHGFFAVHRGRSGRYVDFGNGNRDYRKVVYPSFELCRQQRKYKDFINSCFKFYPAKRQNRKFLSKVIPINNTEYFLCMGGRTFWS